MSPTSSRSHWQMVEKIIAVERPDALLPTMGGQTALNCALDLARHGVLEKYDVELIGASREAIDKAEDREKFKKAMTRIGLASPRSSIAHSLEEALQVQAMVGFPTIIRPSFTLGGTGGGIAYNKEEFVAICERGLDASPTHELLIEESVIGWKEFEMEVVRDHKDNCIIVCSIENLDPMGIHTGDSITVAPAQTLTDKEYQIMRDASIACLREIGVDTGGSNVQFGINPQDGRMVIIEMNPRVSRSSALASKATGFPIAKVAAKLAVGYTLDELRNDITGGVTPASFEPTIDYVVTKIPRFAFEKFPQADSRLTTQMKSVGEVMAMGRTFQESMQKALRGLETGIDGFDEKTTDRELIETELADAGPERILFLADAFRIGMSLEEVQQLTRIDPWFLAQIEDIIRQEKALAGKRVGDLDRNALLSLKRAGFSDRRLAKLLNATQDAVRAKRWELNVRPVYKRVDTCAAEFDTRTAYMYSTYEEECESRPTDRKKIMVLGGGPNRIGQGIEFDYCCVHAALALREDGYETIMVNCNPETVSTDYDTSDRLYFEPLTLEDVLEIVAVEKPFGVIVQYGGQTPLKLAQDLEANGVPIIGTNPDMIDCAEDRERFQKMLVQLKLKQPANRTARNPEAAIALAQEIGYPLVVRPSYVLGGRAMEIVHEQRDLERYMREAVKVSNDSPVLLDRFLNDAIEVDVDAICDGEDVLIGGIMEHIEQAGVHSGDSACSLPPFSLSKTLQDELRRQTEAMAQALQVVGLMNVQFAIQNDVVFVLEVNPRASRTVPYVSKATGLAAGQDCRALHGRADPQEPGHRGRSDSAILFGEGGGISVHQISGCGYDSRSGDEVHRRSHGRGHNLCRGLREIAARRRREAAVERKGLHQRAQLGQAKSRRNCAHTIEARIQPAGDARHGCSIGRSGFAGYAGQQSRRGPAAHRGYDQERRGRADRQHGRRPPQRDTGLLFDPALGIAGARDLFHDDRRRACGLHRHAAHAGTDGVLTAGIAREAAVNRAIHKSQGLLDDEQDSIDRERRRTAAQRTASAQDGGAPAGDRRHPGGAFARRSVRER